MNFTPGTTFAEFKSDFYGKTKDLSLYDCGEINILKIVLDGLKVNYISRGKISTPFFLPGLAWNFVQFAKRILKFKSLQVQKKQTARVLFADLSGRSETERNGVSISYYFDRLLTQHSTPERLHIIEGAKSNNYPHDLDLRVLSHLQFAVEGEYEKKLRKNLLTTYSRLSRSKFFSQAELENIKIAIQSFYVQFRIWDELLKQYSSLRYAIIEQHYHHEGLLLALKKRNIPSYEIQHGLISESDIFYVFPKEVSAVRDKCLFPDKILVYGNYWKQALLRGGEFSDKQIVVTGDFREKEQALKNSSEEKIIKDFVGNANIILISSQTFMHEHYIGYCQWLATLLKQKHPDWKIILKIHPNEKTDLYKNLSTLDNVLVSKSNILYLFNLSKIHISVYSTTLFDSLEYKLANFSLELPAYRDYTEKIVSDKIAVSLQPGEDPVEKALTPSSTQIDPQLVYAPFSEKNYKELFAA